MKITISDGDFGFTGRLPEDLLSPGTEVEFTFRGKVIYTGREQLDVTPSFGTERQIVAGEHTITVEVTEINGLHP